MVLPGPTPLWHWATKYYWSAILPKGHQVNCTLVGSPNRDPHAPVCSRIPVSRTQASVGLSETNHIWVPATMCTFWYNVYSPPTSFESSYSPFWRRQWHPTPVLLPGESHGQRSLVGCSPWGRWESDTTEWLPFHFLFSCIGEGNGNPLQCSCLENPGTGEPGGLLSVGSHRVRHDWSDLAAAAA